MVHYLLLAKGSAESYGLMITDVAQVQFRCYWHCKGGIKVLISISLLYTKSSL